VSETPTNDAPDAGATTGADGGGNKTIIYVVVAALVVGLLIFLLTRGGDDEVDEEPIADDTEETEDDTDVDDDADEGDEADEADDSDATEDEDDTQAAGECSPDALDTFTAGQLTVATGDPAFPPWVEDDDPESGEGFEAAVVYALAAELGYADGDVVWVRTGFDEAIAPGPKDYDFNIQQYSIREDRLEVVDFSVPYYEPDKALVALPDSAVAGATSFEELRDANWGAAIGTTDLTYIEDIIGASDVAVFDDQAGVFQALQGGQIDATVVALPTALFATAVQVPEADILATLPPDESDLGLGLLFEQDNPILPCIDEALESLREDGTLDDIAGEWLGVGTDIPEISG
jgi:polar amino acid transport system substrate-binding protein